MSWLGITLIWLVGADPALAVSPDPATIAVPPGELAKARALVGKLGSDSFDEREESQEELAGMGRLALPALLDGLHTSPSAEVRARCRALLPRAGAADLRVRLATFLADTDGKYQHELPGWNEFSKVAGATAAARAVFADLLRDPDTRLLVKAAAGPPGELGRLVADRKLEMFPRRRGFSPPAAAREDWTAADLLALMYAESRVAGLLVPTATTPTAYTLVNTPGFNAAVTDPGGRGVVYRAVLARWVATRDDPAAMYTAAHVVESLRPAPSDPKLLAAAATAAANLIRSPAGRPAYRATAITTLVRHEAADHLPALEAVFAEETPLWANRRGVGDPDGDQLRDAALAAALLLTGQEPERYGFVAEPGGGRQFSPDQWHLSAGKRSAAFEKWKVWRAEHPAAGRGKGGD